MYVSAISVPKIEIPMTSFYYVVSFDEEKSEHEGKKTPPQRRMSLMHIGQKRFMNSHLKYYNPNYSFMYRIYSVTKPFHKVDLCNHDICTGWTVNHAVF